VGDRKKDWRREEQNKTDTERRVKEEQKKNQSKTK
jgi:hypothetical protein